MLLIVTLRSQNHIEQLESNMVRFVVQKWLSSFVENRTLCSCHLTTLYFSTLYLEFVGYICFSITSDKGTQALFIFLMSVFRFFLCFCVLPMCKFALRCLFYIRIYICSERNSLKTHCLCASLVEINTTVCKSALTCQKNCPQYL